MRRDVLAMTNEVEEGSDITTLAVIAMARAQGEWCLRLLVVI